MSSILGKIASLRSRVPVAAVVLLAMVLGYVFRGLVSAPPPPTRPVAQKSEREEAQVWTCSMHPEVRLPKPGQCPKCGMDLIPVRSRGTMELGARTLTLSPAARKLAEVVVTPVTRRFVEAEIRMVGKVDYDETRLKYITAWVPGRLDRLYVDYTGVPVRKGEHLVYMYSPELLIAQVELLRAIEAVKAIKGGGPDDVGASAEAMVEDVREKLRLWGLTPAQIREIEQRGQPSDHLTIYAPIGGIVIHKNANEGMYVDTGTRIYTIADLSRVWVKLDAYESDLAWLRYGQKVQFEVEAYPGERFNGTIAFIDPVLTAETRTVKVRVNVDNADGRLKPEMFVRAVVRARIAEGNLVVNDSLAGKWICPMHPEIVKETMGHCDLCEMPLVRAETLGYVSPSDLNAKPPLVIPASAPLITGKRAVVYVELPYLVRAGLAEGERVVVRGNFKIDSAVQILARPSMMSPEGGGPAPGHQHGGGEPVPAAGRQAGEGPRQEPLETQPGRGEVPRAFANQLEAVYADYFRIQTALGRDAAKDAQKAAKGFLEALDAVDMKLLAGKAHHAWMKEVKDLAKSASALVAAGDLEQARRAFALLSESMIAVARRFGTGDLTVYRLHCPMAFNNRGADWLQEQKGTANPYFGSAMFRCGSVRETFEPASRPTSVGGEGN